MNAQNAKEYLPLVQALADGKTIQCRYQIEDDWYEESEINFNWPLESYRIKPKPRTFKLYIIDTANGETVMTTHPTFDSRWKQITVQEVAE
jgi:hypothetical protein